MGRGAKKHANNAVGGRANPRGTNNIAAYEPVLREHCQTEVQQLYDSLPQGVKATMLEALSTSCRTRYLMYVQQKLSEQSPGTSPSTLGRNGPGGSCSLVRVLQSEFPHLFDSEAAGFIRETLKTWGSPNIDSMQMITEHQLALIHQEANSDHGRLQTSSTFRKDASADGRVDWKALRPITARGLKLFQTARGTRLDGQLIVPPLCMTGMSTIMRDKDGRLVRIAAYNLVPGGKPARAGADDLTRKYPAGARIAVAEPYQKVAQDGSLAVRVDCPTDILVLPETEAAAEDGQGAGAGSQSVGEVAPPSLHTALNSVQEMTSGGNSEDAVWEALAALRRSCQPGGDVDLLIALLANRAHVLLKIGEPGGALRDAATVLLFDPAHPKAWHRYRLALRQLVASTEGEALAARAEAVAIAAAPDGEQQGIDAGGTGTPQLPDIHACGEAVGRAVDKSMDVKVPANANVPAGRLCALEWKQRGNELCMGGDFEDAAECYSAAITNLPEGDVFRCLLLELAEAAYVIGSSHSALSAAAACSRLCADGDVVKQGSELIAIRALTKLGKHDTAAKLLRRTGFHLAGGDDGAGLHKLHQDLKQQNTTLMGAPKPMRLGSSMLTTVSLPDCPDMVYGIEVAPVPGQGRGVCATMDLPAGALVIMNNALVTCKLPDGESGSAVPPAAGSTAAKTLAAKSNSAVSAKIKANMLCELLLGTAVAAMDDYLPPHAVKATFATREAARARERDGGSTRTTPITEIKELDALTSAESRACLQNAVSPSGKNGTKPGTHSTQEAATIVSGTEGGSGTADGSRATDEMQTADGKDEGSVERRQDIPPLSDVTQLLSSRVLPLLPQWADYFPPSERTSPSAAFVDRVCSMNGHGRWGQKPEGTMSELFPLISMMNHSKTPNCSHLSLEVVRSLCKDENMEAADGSDELAQRNRMVVVTDRYVRAHEELTIRYQPDPEIVRIKWTPPADS